MEFTMINNVGIIIQLSTFLLLLGQQQFAVAEATPCLPPPGLGNLLDTQEKCNCFYSFAASGIEDPSNFPSIYAEDSVLEFPQVGKYLHDGIAEYISFAMAGVFVSDYTRVGDPIFFDFTGSTAEQCVAVIAERGAWNLNTAFTQDNQAVCADVVTGVKFFYTMTGDQASPIIVHKQDVWLPDALVSDVFSLFVDSPAAAEYFCDVNVNTCNNNKKSPKKSAKSTKNMRPPKNSKAMENCVKQFNDLPSFSTSGEFTYVDGNTKGCRVVHSFFASTNDVHCPHISFEAEEDIFGLYKCNESAGRAPPDLFTDAELYFFEHVAPGMLELGDAIEIKMEACSNRDESGKSPTSAVA
mmetsp:Transcript_24729/g.44419  ORF Transcript_24729/g.44419 Transcript_24729/m.44419 type:complete len:354 (-) Transcript_24729:63-1124(-)